jgi:RNA polymerase sigma-70 factor (ECF subfamily)
MRDDTRCQCDSQLLTNGNLLLNDGDVLFGDRDSEAALEPMAALEPVAALETNARGMSDEALLKQFVDMGDRECFEALMRRYQYEIYNYLRRYLGDENLAEDAFQLTFISVFRKSQQFDLSRRFRPWLYGIATHQAIDLQRSLSRRLTRSLDASVKFGHRRDVSKADHVPDHRNADSDLLEQAELQQQVRAALDEVGEPGRSVLDLVYLKGLPYKEAAKALNVPVGTVKSRVHSAVRKLSSIWQRTTGSGSDQ